MVTGANSKSGVYTSRGREDRREISRDTSIKASYISEQLLNGMMLVLRFAAACT